MGKKEKSGFLNPMDKIRKDSRKRELRKNKKQRAIAQTTLMKIRDPYEIIGALDRLDRVEFDPYNDPVLSEKVIEMKRQKLMASWGKLMAFNKKEDKERYEELKRIESSYNDRRDNIMREYKAIRSTENVDIDAIPLPSMPPPVPSMSSLSSSTFMNANYKMPINRKPPGCPQGLPPRLEELDIDDVESSEDEAVEEKKNENNLQDFLKEIEAIAGDDEKTDKDAVKEEDNEDNEEENDDKEPIISSLPPIQSAPPILTVNPTPEIDSQDDKDDDKDDDNEGSDNEEPKENDSSEPSIDQPLAPPPPLPLPLVPPPALPLPFRPILSLRPPQLAPQLRPMGPGVVARPPYQPRPRLPFPGHSRHPLDYQQPKPPARPETKTTTIEAKPQLRNLAQDATRFLPTALRNKPRLPVKKPFPVQVPEPPKPAPAPASSSSNTKDAAYEEFMKEMEGLM